MDNYYEGFKKVLHQIDLTDENVIEIFYKQATGQIESRNGIPMFRHFDYKETYFKPGMKVLVGENLEDIKILELGDKFRDIEEKIAGEKTNVMDGFYPQE